MDEKELNNTPRQNEDGQPQPNDGGQSGDGAGRERQPLSPGQRVKSVIGIILCIVFGIMLCANLAIIIQGAFFPSKAPQLFGVTPLVIATDKMSGTREGHIENGDFVVTARKDADKLKVGSVVAYMNYKTWLIDIGRITAIDGTAITVRGDNGGENTAVSIRLDNVLGECTLRIPRLGAFMMFLHEPLGMILCIGIPFLCFVIYDVIYRNRQTQYELKMAEAAAIAALGGSSIPTDGEASGASSSNDDDNTGG